jgi:DNA-binding NtrC family response regulator
MAEKILVIDDEESSRQVVEEVLLQEGYDVDVASSGEEGLNKIYKGCYDLVITDHMMPGIQGIELIEKVKQFNPDIPTIIMTAYGTVEISIRAYDAGADGFILKPIDDINEVLKEVRRVLNKKKRELKIKLKDPD